MRCARFAWVLLILTGCNTVFPDVRLAYREARPRLGPAVAFAGDELGVLPVATWQEDKKLEPQEKPTTLIERLRLPAIIPGAEALDIKLPPIGTPKAEVEATFKKYFPPLPELPALPPASAPPLPLADLQDLARTNSPVLRQAALDVEATRGVAIQAGLYPNPTIGYQADAIGNNKTSGAQGAFAEQTIKTPGKLRLARAAALMEVRVSEAKFQQAQAEVLSQVRTGYFAVLAARRNFEVSRALAQFTDQVYQVLVLQFRVGEVAAYEPMQVRVLALQARTQVIQASNRYISAWKQLAAALGIPDMALTELQGQIDQPIPQYEWEATLAQVLSNHSDVQAASAGLDKSALQLQLARVQPIPDVDMRGVVQYDATSDPRRTTAGVQVGIQLPLFDRNQGSIMQASANYRRAQEEFGRVRASLTSRLAEAFERYQTNRALLEYYRDKMLPNQVQAFRGAVARHAGAGVKDVSYNDLVTAEQTLVTLVGAYLNALRDQWNAAIDIGALLQEPDLLPMPREK